MTVKTAFNGRWRWSVPSLSVIVTIFVLLLGQTNAKTTKNSNRIDTTKERVVEVEISVAVLQEQYKSVDNKLDQILRKLE